MGADSRTAAGWIAGPTGAIPGARQLGTGKESIRSQFLLVSGHISHLRQSPEAPMDVYNWGAGVFFRTIGKDIALQESGLAALR